MELNLKNKVVVITGAGQGIGKAVANGFGKEGAKIAICDISQEKLDEVTKEFTELGYDIFTGIVDVSKYEQLEKFGNDVVAHYGQVDVWINHAGIAENKPLLESEPADWQRVININLYSFLYGLKIAGNLMKDHGGVILSTASYSGLTPAIARTAYVATKSATIAVSRMAAGELAPYGIRVCAIAPGTIETPMQKIRTPEEKRKAISTISLQRACKPEELANTYVYLASDAASYLTGITVEVSGGKLCVQNPAAAWERAGITPVIE